jgi:hypothetical protein
MRPIQGCVAQGTRGIESDRIDASADLLPRGRCDVLVEPGTPSRDFAVQYLAKDITTPAPGGG